MYRAPYRVHRLIQDLMKQPEAAERFRADPEPFFEAYGLRGGERALLRDGSKQALMELGVHPNLQMKYLRIVNPPPAGVPGPASAFIERLAEED